MSDTQLKSSPHMPDRSGWARRADVALRARYPNLVTRIFEVTPNEFLLVFDRSLADAASIDFAEVRPVTLRANISNDIPQHYLREVPPIRDKELALHYEGFPFSRSQLTNLIIGRFPDLPIAAIYDGGQPMTVTVELTSAIAETQEKALLHFCTRLGGPAPFRILVSQRSLEDAQAALNPNPISATDLSIDVMSIGAFRLRRNAPTFVRSDEQYWFDNIDAIYAGRLTFDQVPGIYEGDARCYVDATIGDHINFRQLLAYYDTIYFSPPLRQDHQTFLSKQAFTDKDVLHLVESGRLRILQTQPEERLSTSFLEAALERSPDAIIGRRTAAALLASDLVQTANAYRLNDPDNFGAIGELGKLLAEKAGLAPNFVLRQMLWPLEARRQSVAALFNGGSKGMVSIGLGPPLAEILKKLTGKDLQLEAMMLSERVHIAHAIHATSFPGHHEPAGSVALSNTIGDTLNFYRSFNTFTAAAWIGNVERKEQGKLLLPPLDLLAFDADVPIQEVLDATSRPSMRNRARGLFNRLADMDEIAREVEIKEINSALRRFGRPVGIISLDTADTAVGLASTACSFSWPPGLGILKFGAQLLELGSRNPRVDRFVEQLRIDMSPSGGKRRELDFLSQISRVATLKRRTVS